MAFRTNSREIIISAEVSSRTVSMARVLISETFMVSYNDWPRVLFHSAVLCNILGGFWLLDSLKDPILVGTIGIENQPAAKVLIFYGTVFMVISALLSDPVQGLDNTSTAANRVLGWCSYCLIESYGSLMVALFWSFTNNVMDLEQAKGAYGVIIAVAQLGAITGATVATQAASIGMPQLCLMAAMSVFTVSLMMKTYHLIFLREHPPSHHHYHVPRHRAQPLPLLPPSDEHERVNPPHPADTATVIIHRQQWRSNLFVSAKRCGTVFAGFYEGVSLILAHGYVLLLMGVSCLYEIVLTVLDFTFKVQSKESLSSSLLLELGEGVAHGEALSIRFADLMGRFGQMTNIVSLLVSVFGFSFLVRRLGVSSCLLIFPALLFLAVILTNFVPSLWVIFFLVSVLKALTYSLVDPVKELLYMPTSEAIKFKAKAWIDVFGSRFAKAIGSSITHFSHGKLDRLRKISELPAMIICIAYLLLAWNTGKEFDKLIAGKIIVGENHTVRDDKDAVINGLRPGDVGYEGYDPKLFEGVDFPLKL
eukprot:gene11656-24414_t